MAIKVKSRYKHKAHIDLTALIDLIFLLVAFFMVTSTLGSESLISVQLPKAKQTGRYERSAAIISVNSKNEIFLNDKKTALKSLMTQLKELKQKNEKLKVVIRGDRKAHYQTMISIIDYLNQSGIPVFTLSTIQQ